MASTVQEIFENSISIEKKYKVETKEILHWDYTDVLFSFRGIYTVGLSIYFKDKFKWCGTVIRPLNPKSKNSQQRAYSLKFLKATYEEYNELNDLKELKEFIEVYHSIGNLIPIWPGGNVHRGQSGCYDLPNIYFNKSNIRPYANIFFSEFCEKENHYMNDVLNGKYKALSIEELSDFSKLEYIEFLKYVTTVIKERETIINKLL